MGVPRDGDDEELGGIDPTIAEPDLEDFSYVPKEEDELGMIESTQVR